MERNDMQLTEGHTLTDHLFKLPICIAERPKPKVENEVKEDSFCHFEIGPVQDATESDQSAEKFIIETLNNNNSKDRLHLMKIEKELIIFLKSDSLQILKFPEMSSYNRMLVHKVAAYFGLDHNVDLVGNSVIVSKTWKSQTPDKRFQDLLNESKLCDDIDQMSIVNPPKRSILKRNNCESLVNKEVIPLEKSIKTLEEREEEYQQARARIFKDACQTMNMIEDTLDTNDILKAIDENLTLDERKMLTVPEILEDKNESGIEEPEKKDNLIEINKNYESGNSTECILTTSLSYLILPRSNSCQIVKDYSNDDLNSIDTDVQETGNFFKNEVSKKKSKKTKTKSNLLLINNDIGDHDKNPDPQKVAPLLETLTTNNTYSENVYNLHVQGVSQNFTSIPYPLITQTSNYNHFTNVINKDPKMLPSKQPIIKSLPYLDNFNINLYATTMPSKVSSSFDYAGNSQLGVNNPKGDLNVVESQYHFPNRPSNLNYEPRKNLGSSILPALSNYQPSQNETHYPFINSKFSLPSVTTYPQNQSHSVYNPLITTSQSWHTGLNNLVLQGNLAALGQSMANLQQANHNHYPNSNKPVPYQNVSNPINVPRVITNVPLLLNQTTNISYPQNLITNIYNNQSQNLPRYNYLAATVNSAHYLQNLPQTIYSNRQNNLAYPILTTVPIHNQYAPSQQQYVQVVSKPYSTNPYLNAINSQFMVGNASLQNKASVPPPLMNQLILPDTNTYNSLPKMPVPLMGQNIGYIGQPKPMKPNGPGSTLQQDIIKFQNAMGIHKPHHYSSSQSNNINPYQTLNNVNKSTRNIKHNRNHNEVKKQNSISKLDQQLVQEHLYNEGMKKGGIKALPPPLLSFPKDPPPLTISNGMGNASSALTSGHKNFVRESGSGSFRSNSNNKRSQHRNGKN